MKKKQTKTPKTTDAPATPPPLADTIAPATPAPAEPLFAAEIEWLAPAEIAASPLNPRTHFDADELDDLRASFQAHGFTPSISHLLVRPLEYKAERQLGREDLDILFRGTGEEQWRCVSEMRTPPAAGLLITTEDAERAIASFPHYELILGERRWGTSRALELEKVPVVVQSLCDRDVLELQLVENLQRSALTPIEEGRAYARLMEMKDAQGGRITKKSVADRVGRSEMHVKRRLDLVGLDGTAAGQAVESGAITITHARLLAMLPSQQLRDELTQTTIAEEWQAKDLERHIRERVVVEIRGGGFDPADETLVAVRNDAAGRQVEGGACASCFSNTKNAEPDSGGQIPMCLNPECFKMKQTAAHALWMDSVRADGVTPLTREEAELLFDFTGCRLSPSCGYVEQAEAPATWLLRDPETPAPGTWKKLVKGRGVPLTIAKDSKGEPHELLSRELAIAAATENGHEIFKDQTRNSTPKRSDADEEEFQRKQAAQRDYEHKRDHAIFAALIESARGTKRLEPPFWKLILLPMIEEAADLGVTSDVAPFFGWQKAGDFSDDTNARAFLVKQVEKLPESHMPALALALAGSLSMNIDATRLWMKRAAGVLGVDAKAIDQGVKRSIAAAAAQAAIEAEIAGGLAWISKREKAAEFEWDGAEAVSPDVCEVRLPAEVKHVAAIFAARAKSGWRAGWKISLGKSAIVEKPCDTTPPDYGTRELAVRAALLEMADAFRKYKLPVAAERVDAYVAQISAATPAASKAKGKGKGKKKGGKK